MGVFSVCTPGKLPVKFRMIRLKNFRRDLYIDRSLQKSQEVLAPTTTRSGMCQNGTSSLMVRLEGGSLLSFCFHVLDTRSACQWRVIEAHKSHHARARKEHTESHREKVFHFLEHSANHSTGAKGGRLYLQELNAEYCNIIHQCGCILSPSCRRP